MEEKDRQDKFKIIRITLIIIFSVIFIRIIYMTTFKKEHYAELAENKAYKEIPVEAPRGEIRDRYGRLLAGNRSSFTLQISKDGIDKTKKANDISLDIISILDKNSEKYIDQFPIYIENGKYFYTFDKNIRNYKKDNEIPLDLDAKSSFYFIVDKAVKEGKLTETDKRLEPVELQRKLNENGYYPPILVSSWKFTEQRNKEDWLKSYKIDIVNAETAFKELREYYEVDEELNDLDARKIFIVRDLLKSQGYTQYKPVTIASDITEKTISEIEEKAIELPGISVAVEPVRYYPNENLASHVIGYMGSMPAPYENEEGELVNPVSVYEEESNKKYDKSDRVGASAIEKSYEYQLHGQDGYKRVQVDSVGRITKEIDSKAPKAGDTIYLSIDKDLQQVAEDSLEQITRVARTGGTFQSKYGNVSFGEVAPNSKSAGTIAIDVKTGDVLALASHPDFDPNLFATGITTEDYNDLLPENPNDVLAPNALYNLVTQGAFQQGSTFKLITGMAAIDNGISPNYTIQDPGYIKLGNRIFGDLVWHSSRRNHGSTDLYKAIQESCNVYFWIVSTGKNWTGGANPPVKIGPDTVLEYARKFGLDEASGLDKEIGERPGKVPKAEDKLSNTKKSLKVALDKEMRDAFTDITKDSDQKEYEKRIDEIVSWADENPGRGEIMERMAKLNVKEERITDITDLAKFSYFNFAKWTDADTFNLAIGQGENTATVSQMARYIASIANGGDLVELSVIDKTVSSDYSDVNIDVNDKEQIDFNNRELLQDLKKGMVRVARQGSGKKAFGNFPVDVAVKTGTAQKSGKIPTKDEEEYLLSNMGAYNVSAEEAKKLAEEFKKADGIKENDPKTNARYLRKAIKELNPKINDEQIDRFKPKYGDFAWVVAFAPADNPEIAVVTMMPQGNTSSFALLPTREIIGAYLGIGGENGETNKENVEENKQNQQQNINFTPQLKK